MEEWRDGGMEEWRNGGMEEWGDGGVCIFFLIIFYYIDLERKNKNRGFRQLEVWQNAVDLFVLLNNILKTLPFDLSKSKMNTLDACHSISRNIAEGYCRRSIKEYLQFLNFSLGSCGELNSAMISFHKAGHISDEEFAAWIFYTIKQKISYFD